MPRRPKHYSLIWDDKSLAIQGPPSREIKAALTYTAKRLEPDPTRPYQRRTKKTREKIFHRTDHHDRTCTLLTFQGMLDAVITEILKFGGTFKIYDRRHMFPAPNLGAMHGFRNSQEELLTKALKQNRSGLIVAPTRYGKTAMLCNILNAYAGLKAVVLAPGVDLLPQLEGAIEHFCPGREVKGIYTGSRNRIPSDDITVCSVDSIDKLDYEGTRLVVVDEPHTVATGPRSSAIAQFENARVLGLGATVSGRWEGNDIMLTGLFGPKLAERTYTEAVEEGAICPIKVKFIKVPFRHFQVRTRATAYKNLLTSKTYLETIRKLSDEVIPKDWQTLFFISNEKQGKAVQSALGGDAVLAMDKLMKKAGERREMFRALKEEEFFRCVCSNIYSTGITLPEVRCAVNCAEGGANILSIQKPGRLAEIKDNKAAGYMFDTLFVPTNSTAQLDSISDRDKMWKLPVNDCWARIKSYQAKGYDVEIVDNLDDLKPKIV